MTGPAVVEAPLARLVKLERHRARRDPCAGGVLEHNDRRLVLMRGRLLARCERNAMDGEWFTRLTSNDFLSAFGNPTRVEASIGKLYHSGGLDAAFAWMDAELVPLFRKQIAKKG